MDQAEEYSCKKRPPETPAAVLGGRIIGRLVSRGATPRDMLQVL